MPQDSNRRGTIYREALGKALGCCTGDQCTECFAGARAVMALADVEQAGLRAAVARVEALIEQWDGATEANADGYPIHARIMQLNIAELRAALDGDE